MSDMTDKAAEWVSKNMTANVSSALANTIYGITQSILTAPFDLFMNLVEILQNKKYKKYIVVIWSIIGASVLVLSVILTLLDSSFPIHAWGLGIGLASLAIIILSKIEIKFNVTNDLTKEINEELKQFKIKEKEVPTVEQELDSDDLLDDDEELLDDDDDVLEDDDDELLEDDDSTDSDDEQIFDADMFDDLMASVTNSDSDVDNFKLDSDSLKDFM